MKRPSNSLVTVLLNKEKKLALAESVTCGLAAHKLGLVKGVSGAFMGSIVCYDVTVKQTLLGISKKKLEQFTAESQEVTDALAKKLPSLLDADVFAAVTGLSSPGGSENGHKPVGTVFYSVWYQKKIYNERKRYRGTSSEIKEKACDGLFKFIEKVIKQN
jgi:nicotinamide-nucleotide amidase